MDRKYKIISYAILIIFYIFIIIQSAINIKYNKNNDKHITAERLVYEHFSKEVYSNINSKLIIDMKFIDINQDCPNDYELTKFPIKLESFYDCEGVSIRELDKDICQNKITNSHLCCEKHCCYNKVVNKKSEKFCNPKLTYKDEDHRQNYCSKFSKYQGKFYILNGTKICIKRLQDTYYDLLANNQRNSYCNLIFDSKNHNCCVQTNLTNYYNGRHAVVKNILASSTPSDFEMENNLKISSLLNKKEYDEDKIKNYIEKLNDISDKTIHDTFYDSNCEEEDCLSKYYFIINNSYYLLSDLISNSDEYIFKDFNFVQDENISHYTRDYIGFNNLSELKKFKSKFNENNPKDNDLYRISTTLYPNYTSIVFGVIVSIWCIIMIINFSIRLCGDYFFGDSNFDLIIKYILFGVLFIAYLLIYLVCYYFKYEEIFIDMEEFYQKVLNKYNNRRKQIYLLIGIIILSFDLFFEIIIQYIKYLSNGKPPEAPQEPEPEPENRPPPLNGPSTNAITVQVKIQGTECKTHHIIKLYKNQPFSNGIARINKIFEKCTICGEFEIDNFVFNGVNVNKEEIVSNLKIQDGDIIYGE